MNYKLLTTLALATAALASPALAKHHGHHGANPEWFIERFDNNEDLQVTKEEFTAARRERFDLTDEDGNGTVDEDEYVQEWANRMDTKMEEERKGHSKQTKTRFKALDKDKDERIDWEEYQASGNRSFERFDTNDDNLIDADEPQPESYWKKKKNKDGKEMTKEEKAKRKKMWAKFKRRAIRMPTTHNKAGMMNKYDRDGDGVITYEEFNEKRRADFDLTDENGDGWLSNEEYLVEFLNRVDDVIEKTRKKQLKQAGVRFGALDKNEDAKMTFEEYQLSGMKMFERNDTNKDGLVSQADPKPEKKCKGKKDKDGKWVKDKDCKKSDKKKSDKKSSKDY